MYRVVTRSVLAILALVLGVWSAAADARSLEKSDTYQAFADELSRVCPTDGSLKPKLMEPYPDEPAALVAALKPDGRSVSDAASLAEVILGMCSTAHEKLQMMTDEDGKETWEARGGRFKADYERAKRASHGSFKGRLLLDTLSSFVFPQRELLRLSSVAERPLSHRDLDSWSWPADSPGRAFAIAPAECGGEFEPRADPEGQLAGVNNQLAGIWTTRRVALRWHEHAGESWLITVRVQGEARDRWDAAVEDCERNVIAFEKVVDSERKRQREAETRQQRKRLQSVLAVLKGCGEDIPDPTTNPATVYQQPINACTRGMDSDWQAQAYATVGGDPDDTATLDDFIGNVDQRLVAYRKAHEIAKANAELTRAHDRMNQARCEKLASAAHNRTLVLAWKACMSNADLSSTARRYEVTDADLYEDFMTKKAMSCASSTLYASKTRAFYDGCVFSHDRSPMSFYRGSEDVPSPCYGTSIGTICIDDILASKYRRYD